MKKMMCGSTVVSILVLLAASSGCTVDDASNGETLRQEAQETAEAALDDYLTCREIPPNECASESEELEVALEELEVVAGDVAFRAVAVAICGISGTVNCEGDSCWATNNVGCACTTNGQLSSVESCKGNKA